LWGCVEATQAENARLREALEEIKSTSCKFPCEHVELGFSQCRIHWLVYHATDKPVEMGHIFADALSINNTLFEDRHISADDMKFMKDMNKLPQTNPVGTNHCFADGCKDPNTCICRCHNNFECPEGL
jgi:hypothetical protein